MKRADHFAQPLNPLSFSANTVSFSPTPSPMFTLRRSSITMRDVQRFRSAWNEKVIPSVGRLSRNSTPPSPSFEITLTVQYLGRQGNEREETQILQLLPQRCHFGGCRWWFVCPSCPRRVYALYLDGKFKCRACAALQYRSRNWSDNVRLMHHYADLVEGLDRRPGPNPRRYRRYVAQENHHGSLGLAAPAHDVIENQTAAQRCCTSRGQLDSWDENNLDYAPTRNLLSRMPRHRTGAAMSSRQAHRKAPVSGHTSGIAVAQPLKNPSSNSGTRDMTSPELPRRLCSIEKASAYLSLSTWTVRRMIWSGTLPHLRCGRRILLDVRDLDAWIEREKVQGN